MLLYRFKLSNIERDFSKIDSVLQRSESHRLFCCEPERIKAKTRTKQAELEHELELQAQSERILIHSIEL